MDQKQSFDSTQDKSQLVPAKLPKKPKAPLIIGALLLMALLGVGGWQTWEKFGKTPEIYITGAAKPDLIVQRIELDSGVSRRVNFWIKNIGQTTVSGTTRYMIETCGVKWDKDTGEMKTDCKTNAQANQSLELKPDESIKRWFQAVGGCPPNNDTNNDSTFPVDISLDTGNIVDESDEKNNDLHAELENAKVKIQCETDEECDCIGSCYCSNCSCIHYYNCWDADGGKNIYKNGNATSGRAGWSSSYDMHYKDLCIKNDRVVSQGGKIQEFFCDNCELVGGKKNKNCAIKSELIDCNDGERGTGYECRYSESGGAACVKISTTPTSTPIASFEPEEAELLEEPGLIDTEVGAELETDIDGEHLGLGVMRDGKIVYSWNDLLEVLKNMENVE